MSRARVALPGHLAALASGVALAVATSGGIMQERLSAGATASGLAANALVMFVAMLLLGLVPRWSAFGPRIFFVQAVGAVLGITLVHLSLRQGWVSSPEWLAERPAQFVNDGVSAFVTLAIVWACARRLDARLLFVALLTVTLYKVTGHLWHLDAPPGGFTITVQDFVLAQVGATALALPIYGRIARITG